MLCYVPDMHEENIDNKFNSENKLKEILFDRTIEQLEDLDLSSLISYVEDKLNSFSKLQIILLGITSIDHQYKNETEPQVIVKTEEKSDDLNGVDYDYNDYDQYKHYEQLEEDVREKKAEDRDETDTDFVPDRHFRKGLEELGIAPVKIKLEKKVKSDKEKVPKKRVSRKGVKGKKFRDGTIDVNGTFVCEDCGKDIQGYYEYKRHKHNIHRRRVLAKREREYFCNLCGITMTSTYSKYQYHKKACEANSVDEKTFMCTECGKAFATNHKLNLHKSNVHPSKPKKKYEQSKKYCPYPPCDYATEGKQNLENHINRIHLNKPITKEHVCQICGNAYNKAIQLRGHISSVHNLEKPHKCEICHKAFNRKQRLKEHMDIHTGVQRYKCPYCEKPFNNHGSMFHHKKNCSYNPEK